MNNARRVYQAALGRAHDNQACSRACIAVVERPRETVLCARCACYSAFHHCLHACAAAIGARATEFLLMLQLSRAIGMCFCGAAVGSM